MDIQVILAKLKQFPVAIVSGLVALILVIAIVLRGGAIPDLDAELEQLNRQVSQIRSNEAHSIGLEEELSILNELTTSIDDRLLNRQERAINVQFFYNFDLERNLINVITVNQMPPPDSAPAPGPPPAYDTITFAIQAEGTFPEILRFLHELRNGEKLMRVQNFTVEQAARQQNGTRLRLNMTVNALGRKEEPAAPRRS